MSQALTLRSTAGSDCKGRRHACQAEPSLLPLSHFQGNAASSTVRFDRRWSLRSPRASWCYTLLEINTTIQFLKLWPYLWLRWSRGSVLAFGNQVRGFAPGRSRRIYRTKKILSTPFFGGEVKPSAPCPSFTACKRSLNVTWKSAFRQNSRTFLAQISTFRR